MMMTDPISDMLTRVRNGIIAGKKTVDMPSSKMRHNIARILTEEKFIRGYKILPTEGPRPELRVYLRYNEGKPVVKGIKRVSKPGKRVYARLEKLPRVRNGLGVAILSTSKGVLTDRQAKMLGVGGEVLCYIW
ncbi:MAG TPA: 30S ribosomal protein S8 [candidate division Zixibacteria bacterium]|nr:30S ribosomal protein S8 [candidate division Zixibacteria bacterium]